MISKSEDQTTVPQHLCQSPFVIFKAQIHVYGTRESQFPDKLARIMIDKPGLSADKLGLSQ